MPDAELRKEGIDRANLHAGATATIAQFRGIDVILSVRSELYRRWHPTHGIDVNDAMLAATVAATGGKIYTQNRKHYPMADIAVAKG